MTVNLHKFGMTARIKGIRKFTMIISSMEKLEISHLTMTL